VASHLHDADETLSRLYVDEAPAMYRRLLELGLRFAGTMQFANMSQPWGHELPTGDRGGGAQIIERLERAAVARGVRILTGTAALRLIRGQSGAIEGVTVDSQIGTGSVEAGAVVIATGGFTRSPSLIRTYGRLGTESILPITGPGSNGDGLVMALAQGAATSYIGRGVIPTVPVEPVSRSGCTVNYFGGILLNKEGRRFCDESALYVDICWAGLEQTEHLMIHVFDEAARAAYSRTMVGQVMAGGELLRADTLPELLDLVDAATGIDTEAALTTLQRYHDAITEGTVDELGRRHLQGTEGALVPLATPPFCAIVAVPGTTHFNGGVKINDRMQIIDNFGQPIPSLYAAGEVTGGFHGSGYLPATHVGSALIFGRRAGRMAATR
jgi:fumarate reductase flavoprotein subunit